MATASAVEIQRAAEAKRVADALEAILERLERIERALTPAKPVTAQPVKGRAV